MGKGLPMGYPQSRGLRLIWSVRRSFTAPETRSKPTSPSFFPRRERKLIRGSRILPLGILACLPSLGSPYIPLMRALDARLTRHRALLSTESDCK